MVRPKGEIAPRTVELRSLQRRGGLTQLLHLAAQLYAHGVPLNLDYFVVLANHYLKSGRPALAKKLAENTLQQFPDHAAARSLLQQLGQ